MTREDYKEFCNFMGAAAEAVGKQSPSDAALMLSFEALKKYELTQIHEALTAHLRGPEGRFMPTPSHIVEQIEGKPEDIAAVAWSLVARVLNNGGSYKSVRFPFPAYHYAIEQLGGWTELGDKYDDCNTREAMFLAKEFKQFYLLAGRAGANWDTVLPYLPGIYEEEDNPRPMAKKVLIVATGEFVPRDEFLAGLPATKQAALCS